MVALPCVEGQGLSKQLITRGLNLLSWFLIDLELTLAPTSGYLLSGEAQRGGIGWVG